MNIGVFVNTSPQAHFYNNIINNLEKKGHKIKIIARDYGGTLKLLNMINYKYSTFPRISDKPFEELFVFPFNISHTCKILKNFNPDILIGSGIYSPYVAKLLNVPCILFNDTEPKLNKLFFSTHFKLSILLIDAIITPKFFLQDFGKKQIRIDSFKELSYLHPNYFKPNNDIFGLLNIGKKEKFTLLRFNAFDALHDIGISGFTLDDKIHLVKKIKEHTKVFISSESKLPQELEQYKIKIPFHRIHDVLYYAEMFIGDTGTMTTEAAILGTPAIICHSRVDRLGNFIELEKKYGLIFSFKDSKKALKKAIKLIEDPHIKEGWREKRERLIKDKIDITEFMIWFIENYPKSLREINKNPDIQNRFR